MGENLLAVQLRADGLGFTPNNVKYLKVLSGIVASTLSMEREERYFYDVLEEDRTEAAKAIQRLRSKQKIMINDLRTIELRESRDGALWRMSQGLISMTQGVLTNSEEAFQRSVLSDYGL